MSTFSKTLSSLFVGLFTLGVGASAQADRAITMKLRHDHPQIVKARSDGSRITTIERGRSGKVDVVKVYKVAYKTNEISASPNLLPGAIAKVKAQVGGKDVTFRVTNADGLSGLTDGGQIRLNVKGAKEAKLVRARLDSDTGAPKFSVGGDGSVKGRLAAAASKAEKENGFDWGNSRVTSFDGKSAVIVATGHDKIPGQKYGGELKSVRKLTVDRDGTTLSASRDLLPRAKAELAKFEANAGKNVIESKIVGMTSSMKSIEFKDKMSNPDADMLKKTGDKTSRKRLVRVTSYGTGKFANRGEAKTAKLLVTDSPNDLVKTDR